MADDKITLRCRGCGSDKFQVPSARLSAAHVVACAGCGARARYGDLQAEAVQLAQQHVQQALRNAFRGVKGITIKLG